MLRTLRIFLASMQSKYLAKWLLAVMVVILSTHFLACESETPKTLTVESKQLTFLFFNDFHGHLKPFTRAYGDEYLSGGFAHLAAMTEEIRTKNIERNVATYLFSGGDNLQGTPLSTAFMGQAEFEAFNAAGVDASVVGNHDLDYGLENLLYLRDLADFPLLSANIYELNTSKRLFQPYKIFNDPSGLRVGVVGLTTPETVMTTHPLNVQSIRFTRPDLAMQSLLLSLLKKTDVLVVLSHLGLRDDLELARQYPEINVIIGGHSHSMTTEPMRVGDVLICQAGDRGLMLGRLDLEVLDNRVYMTDFTMLPVMPSRSKHEGVAAVIDSFDSKLSTEISRVVGRSDSLLNAERASIRLRETNLGDLTSDLMRLQTDSDVAVINGGAIRSSILEGDITLESVMRAYPMNNEIVTMNVTGEQLLLALRRSIKGMLSRGPSHPFGGFLQVSGVRLVVESGQLMRVFIGGKSLQLYKDYRLATIDFLAAGGDGYRELKEGRDHYNTGINLRDMFVNYLKQKNHLRVETDGRMIFR